LADGALAYGDERVVAVIEPEPGVDPARLREALRGPLARMGGARPDELIFAPIPLAGRSRKPDRAAAARLAAAHLATARPAATGRGASEGGASEGGASERKAAR
jgi:hypothetical protein